MVKGALALTAGYDSTHIKARIQAFEDFGIHRTGGPGDDQTSQWLVGELKHIGLNPATERFAFPRVEVRRAEVRFGTDTIFGVPLYDGSFTDTGGIVGELCDDDDPDLFGKIVLATSAVQRGQEWSERTLHDRIEQLVAAGCIGLIIPQGDGDRDITLRNASRVDTPLPLPTLQISARDHRTLQSQIMIRGEVALEIDAERLRSKASNVTATIDGTEPEMAPIGIVTPKSGWYTCAAERGGGIAIFLALAESLAAVRLQRSVHLLASSGHELNFYGIRSYARTNRSDIVDAQAWLHLGSSLGALESSPVVAASDEELDAIMMRTLSNQLLEPKRHLKPGPAQDSEVAEISELGTRYVSFRGRHPYCRSPNDLVAKTVDPEHVATWARASRETISALLNLESRSR